MRRWFRLDSLPEDMQVILGDYLEASGNVDPEGLWATPVAVSRLPRVLLDDEQEPTLAQRSANRGVDRGVAYALAMRVEKTPPIVMAHGRWLDGRHRAFAARAQGVATLWAFDLSAHMTAAQAAWFGGLGEVAPEGVEATPGRRRQRP